MPTPSINYSRYFFKTQPINSPLSIFQEKQMIKLSLIEDASTWKKIQTKKKWNNYIFLENQQKKNKVCSYFLWLGNVRTTPSSTSCPWLLLSLIILSFFTHVHPNSLPAPVVHSVSMIFLCVRFHLPRTVLLPAFLFCFSLIIDFFVILFFFWLIPNDDKIMQSCCHDVLLNFPPFIDIGRDDMAETAIQKSVSGEFGLETMVLYPSNIPALYWTKLNNNSTAEVNDYQQWNGPILFHTISVVPDAITDQFNELISRYLGPGWSLPLCSSVTPPVSQLSVSELNIQLQQKYYREKEKRMKLWSDSS